MGQEKRWIVINKRNEVIVDEGWEWCAIANADLINFSVRDREGLYDWRNQRVVMEPRFKTLRAVADTVFEATVDGRVHLVDMSGRKVGKSTFVTVNPFVDGIAAAKDEESDLYGFINLAGEWVIRPSFWHAEQFAEGLSGVCREFGEYFYIDRHGDVVIPGPFIDANRFSEGLAQVRDESGDHYINPSGRIEFSGEESWYAGGAFSCGRADVLSRKQPGRVFFLDKKGKMLGDSMYDKSWAFSENVAAVAVNNRWGLVDLSGKLVVPYQFDAIGFHSCGLSTARIGERCGYIDSTGCRVIAFSYSHTGAFRPSNGLACVEVG